MMSICACLVATALSLLVNHQSGSHSLSLCVCDVKAATALPPPRSRPTATQPLCAS